jgi:uncharacterized damage-inducible protein DinB
VIDFVRTLYRYSDWANTRVLEAAARLGPRELSEPGGASYDSVHGTLVHTMSAQWIWLARWTGTSPVAMLDAGQFTDLDAIRTRWDQIEADTRRFLAALTEHDLTRVVAYRNTRGERWAYPLWQQMVHQVNHATQHRSEIALLLTRFGHSPGDLDLLVFVDEQESRR